MFYEEQKKHQDFVMFMEKVNESVAARTKISIAVIETGIEIWTGFIPEKCDFDEGIYLEGGDHMLDIQQDVFLGVSYIESEDIFLVRMVNGTVEIRM